VNERLGEWGDNEEIAPGWQRFLLSFGLIMMGDEVSKADYIFVRMYVRLYVYRIYIPELQ
jgi:hypothetical protein